MGILDASQQAELEKVVTRVCYFVELQFSSGTQRVSTWNQPISWGGYTWSGLGQLIAISKIDEVEGTEPKGISFSFAAQTSWLSAAIGPVEEYRGRPAKLYMCPLDASFQLVNTPVLCWSGVMDTVTISVDGDEGAIEINAETAAYALKRIPVYRVNAAQQKSRYPTDTGFDYLVDLIGNPQLWLSKKFQAR